MPRYRLTPRAAKDLEEIAAFIAGDRPAAAARLVDDIEARCKALARMPGTERPREELAPGLRSSVVGKYVVCYRAQPGGVEVIRVLHGARDLGSIFEP